MRLIDADDKENITIVFDNEGRGIIKRIDAPTVQAVPLSVLYGLRDELQTEADRQSLITASDLNIAINRINAKIRQYEGSDTK